MNDNTVCCQNRELTEPAGETVAPYKVSLALERTPNGRPYGDGGERRLFAEKVLFCGVYGCYDLKTRKNFSNQDAYFLKNRAE